MRVFRGKRLPYAAIGASTLAVGKKILFVDDDEMWRKRLAASFQAAGYDMVTAQDASEAMAVSEQLELGAIVLDLNLDGEDGVMLLKFLKRNHPKTPVLIFTGVAHDQAAIQKMLKMGADQYLTKNSIEELIVAVSPYV